MKELVERILGPPVTSGEINWYNCTFHADDHPSLAVYNDHVHCYQCNFHARATRFLTEVAGWKRDTALAYTNGPRFEWVNSARKFKVSLPPSEEWRDVLGAQVVLAEAHLAQDVGRHGRKEMMTRAITPEIWTRYRVGWQPEWIEILDTKLAEGLVLPAYKDGLLWSVNVRTRSGRPKYLRPVGGAAQVLYGLDQLVGTETLIVVEGELDALTASTATGMDVVALRGVGNRLKHWGYVFHGYQKVILCLDGDEAGQVAAGLILEEFPTWVNKIPDGDLGKMAQAGLPLRRFLLEELSL